MTIQIKKWQKNHVGKNFQIVGIKTTLFHSIFSRGQLHKIFLEWTAAAGTSRVDQEAKASFDELHLGLEGVLDSCSKEPRWAGPSVQAGKCQWHHDKLCASSTSSKHGLQKWSECQEDCEHVQWQPEVPTASTP